jgi:methylphosphotriester-DNA--protein-cysteine methyltransferase
VAGLESCLLPNSELSYPVRVLVDLKLEKIYDGLLYLADASRNLQFLHSHHHIELEVNLVVQGTITYVVDGLRFSFSPRTLLWLFPEQEHQLVDRSANAQFYVLVFKPALIARSCRTAANIGLKRKTNEEGGVLSTLLQPDAFDLLSKTMNSLMEGSLDPDLLNREAGFGETSEFRFQHNDPDALNAGLHYLLLRCWRSRLTGRATRDPVMLHPAIRRALQLLSDETTERSLEELAKACGVSKSYLCRKFHQQIGVSFIRYRNSLRLSRFFEQYHRTDQLTITEAVYAAGFGSYVQFYKVFSQVYGRGPRSCLRNDSVPIGKPIT